jgi:hypothetical protein
MPGLEPLPEHAVMQAADRTSAARQHIGTRARMRPPRPGQPRGCSDERAIHRSRDFLPCAWNSANGAVRRRQGTETHTRNTGTNRCFGERFGGKVAGDRRRDASVATWAQLGTPPAEKSGRDARETERLFLPRYAPAPGSAQFLGRCAETGAGSRGTLGTASILHRRSERRLAIHSLGRDFGLRRAPAHRVRRPRPL